MVGRGPATGRGAGRGRGGGRGPNVAPEHLMIMIRWATLTATASLATPDVVGSDWGILAGVAGLFAYTIFRSARPIVGSKHVVLATTVEAAAVCALMVITDLFNSPFAFSLVPPIAAAAIASGTAASLRLALASSVALGIPTLAGSDLAQADQRTVIEWTMLYLLISLVASYSHRVLVIGEAKVAKVNEQVDQLDDANHLLFTLHEISQELPSSLNLPEVLDNTLDSIRGLVPMTFAAVLLQAEADDEWEIVRRDGPEPNDDVDDAIASLRTALTTCAVATYQQGSATLFSGMRAGRCVALRLRDTTIGALVVEHATPDIYDVHHDEALLLVAETAALAIDNARMFSRLQSLAAHEERARIARELHDQMGQSLAFLGFELDRLQRKSGADSEVAADIHELRHFVRSMTGDMRDTLADLRTEVGDASEAEATLVEFATRLESRSGIAVNVAVDPDLELAPLRVRELWRITQEAMRNLERHSGASIATVSWRQHPDGVVAEVVDDGVGISASADNPVAGHYGLVGMRERAASIGAAISIGEAPSSSGTRVRVTVPATRTQPQVAGVR